MMLKERVKRAERVEAELIEKIKTLSVTEQEEIMAFIAEWKNE